MMVQSARTLGQMDVQGVKIHLMHYLHGTALAPLHHLAMTREDYVGTVCDQLEVLPASMVIGRVPPGTDRQNCCLHRSGAGASGKC